MTEVFIVGVDGTDQSSRAVRFAASRAKSSGAKLHLVFVIEWSPFSFNTPEENAERHKRREMELERANSIVSPFVEDLSNDGIETSCEVRHGNAGQLLCEIAENQKAAQIVIGRTGDSAFAQRLLGGLAVTLAQVAPVPVTIVP